MALKKLIVYVFLPIRYVVEHIHQQILIPLCNYFCRTGRYKDLCDNTDITEMETEILYQLTGIETGYDSLPNFTVKQN